MDILIGIAIFGVFIVCVHGAYLIVCDKETEYWQKKKAEKNFKKFLKENNYEVLGTFADKALKESKSNVKEYIAQAKKFLNKPIALETYKLVLVVAVVIAIIAVA